ncbi:DnaA regulatory inactivator Hda [Candidatus Endobugula sertula]|uniref:DnaA regulatory inactivator Hda n=1 Tax=Candidatus Endobugula sertula TaxID=62101 RepID=A0A1D2QTV9_9GAMM|nr:DnaA regulatory inactivator Hda [Candidatus Endobugula sertula]
MYKQLPLSITLQVDATFDNYFTSDGNVLPVEALQYFCQHPQEPFFYLSGPSGSGVTHLLQAVQHQLSQFNVQYWPLKELMTHPAEDMFLELDSLDMVILDDLELMAGKTEWELVLFHLYNRLRDSGKQLLIGAHFTPKELEVNLSDLKSRLQWGISYRLQSLNDNDKKRALIFRADALGLRLNDDVTQFILNHCCRDIRQLMFLLDIMDKASLAEKRQLTIPFVKRVLGL